MDEHISAYCQVTLETVAYANSGDVLKVQALLSLAGEHIDIEEDTQWKVRPGPASEGSTLNPTSTQQCGLTRPHNSFWP